MATKEVDGGIRRYLQEAEGDISCGKFRDSVPDVGGLDIPPKTFHTIYFSRLITSTSTFYFLLLNFFNTFTQYTTQFNSIRHFCPHICLFVSI
jgi:hypothetical protein